MTYFSGVQPRKVAYVPEWQAMTAWKKLHFDTGLQKFKSPYRPVLWDDLMMEATWRWDTLLPSSVDGIYTLRNENDTENQDGSIVARIQIWGKVLTYDKQNNGRGGGYRSQWGRILAVRSTEYLETYGHIDQYRNLGVEILDPKPVKARVAA
jgi:hypothetical protein